MAGITKGGRSANWDFDSLAKVAGYTAQLADSFDKFITVGVESMKDSGIAGGLKAKRIEEACELIKEKGKLITKAIEENQADIDKLIAQGEGFDQQALITRAAEIAEQAKKTEATGIGGPTV